MLTAIPRASRSPPPRWPPSPSNVTRSMASGTTPSHPTSSRHEAVLPRQILTVYLGWAARGRGSSSGLLGILSFLLGVFLLKGLYVLPNYSAVMQLFGSYIGTDATTGLRWVNP